MSAFVNGVDLCEGFYREVIAPILAQSFPSLRYSVARIGDGSDVLGYDTEMSADHGWGPSGILFLQPPDLETLGRQVSEILADRLPLTYRGYPTRYVQNAEGSLLFEQGDAGTGRHNVTVTSPERFFEEYVGWNVAAPMDAADWLSIPEQKLLAVTSGAAYHDGIALQALRDRLSYYPRDVWLYLLSAGWNRIGQEEHLMGRAGSAGDELGSAIIGSRLARDLMRLCFLIERRYAPYAKWFGSAFRSLACGPTLGPVLLRVVTAGDWREQEAALVDAYEHVAKMQNALGITEPRSATAVQFYGRPFRVIHLGARFAEAVAAQIADPDVARLGRRRLIGGIDQVSDNTDVLCAAEIRSKILTLYN